MTGATMAIEKDVGFWRGQINSAKGEQKKYETKAKKVSELYSSSTSYNIFYSNVNIQKAYLLENMPKPDIERRFLKKTESDKLKYNTYIQVAKVSEGAINFYADIGDVQSDFKMTTENTVKIGRGISWVVYDPKIETVQLEDGTSEEKVTDRSLTVDSLGYDEYLQSAGKNKKDVWWKARRHLLSREDLQEKFEYEAEEEELNFTSGQESTAQKRAEVWEIWDRTEKKRVFILQSSVSDDFLSDAKDPYKLESFFPCDDTVLLTEGDTLVPIPEYYTYDKKAEALDKLSKRSDKLDNAIKYVGTTANQNAEKIATSLTNTTDGDIVSLSATGVNGDINIANMVGSFPIDGALAISTHLSSKKNELKQDIYDITGISDIARGQTDARETATAQKIKGIFGSLRFQEKQKLIQNHIRNIYQIMTELICEHWDAETLAEITCTDLPTAEEKQAIQLQMAQAQVIQNNPQMQVAVQQGLLPASQVSEDDKAKLEQPTWEDLLSIMRNDKLRNYTIDIESTSTVFDDKEAETLGTQATIGLYTTLVQQAATLQDPNLIKGFIPLMRMALSSTKAGRANSMQIEEAMEGAYKDLLKKQENPEPSPEAMKLQLEQGKVQADQQDREARSQIDMVRVQNDSRKIALEEQKAQQDAISDQAQLQHQTAVDGSNLQDNSRQTDIKQQDANRKDRELEAETKIAVAEILTGVEAPTIAGDVASVG